MKVKLLLLFLIGLLLFPAGAGAVERPYSSYIYDFWGEVVTAPVPYLPDGEITGQNAGTDDFSGPDDIFVTENQEILLSDTGNNRIVYLNEEGQKKDVFSEFENNGQEDHFSKPQGIYVQDNDLYVADTGNKRIIQLSLDGEFIREITRPETDLAGDINYTPLNVAVTDYGKIYVISEGDYEGILEFYKDGTFSGFIGAPQVSPSPVDIFWRQFATEEQRSRTSLFLPTEYNSLSMDEAGLLLAVTGNEIRRLNSAGEDVIRERGFSAPIGDLAAEDLSDVKTSSFVDVVSRGNGRYSVLDQERGRIFTYDNEGHLLYVFGGRGNAQYLFQRPAAIDMWHKKVVVLDKRLEKIMVFKPLDYARNIHQADNFYTAGRYENAAREWVKVLKRNRNFFLAYSQLGNIALNQSQYQEALERFKLGYNQNGYSKAFTHYRREVIEDKFSLVIYIVLAFILIVYLTMKFNLLYRLLTVTGLYKYFIVKDSTSENDLTGVNHFLNKVLSGLKYSLFLIFHPFGGFWDLKNENKGNIYSAFILLAVACYVYIFMRLYTGFLFNPVDASQVNLGIDALSFLLPFFLWSIVNWSLTTLMEGKGTFKDILIYSSYSLTPFILLNIPLTVISRYLTFNEGNFYYFLLVFSISWTLGLLFFGTVVVHDYGLAKTMATVIAILIGIGTLLFIALLFLSVINLMVGYFTTVYQEIILRVY